MNIVWAVVALFSLWALGAGGLAAAGLRERGLLAGVPADLACGAVLLTVLGTLGVISGTGVSLTAVYGLLAITLSLALLRARPGGTVVPAATRPLTLLLLGGTVLLVAVVAGAAASDRLWWDGWAIWTLKANVLLVEGTLPAAFLDPAGPYQFTHLDYPLALPLVDWWIFRHVGEAAPAAASFAGAVWFALLPLLAWSGLRSRVDERIAALAALSIAAFWPVSFFAIGGTADVVVAVALLGAVIELERGLTTGGRAALRRAGVFLALGAMTKNEGLALAVLTVPIGAVALLRGGRRLAEAIPLALPLLLAAPWLAFTRYLGIRADNFSADLDLATLSERGSLLLRGLQGLVSTPLWLPVTVLMGLGALAAARRPETGMTAAWLLAGCYLLVLFTVYVQAPQDLAWLMATSLQRVLGAAVPAIAFLSVLSVARTWSAQERARATESYADHPT